MWFTSQSNCQRGEDSIESIEEEDSNKPEPSKGSLAPFLGLQKFREVATWVLGSGGDGRELEALCPPNSKRLPGLECQPSRPALPSGCNLSSGPCPPSLSQAQKPVVWGAGRADTDHPLFSVSLA